MKNKLQCLIFVLFSFALNKTSAQAKLVADGPGNTYELINGIFSPGYTAVEAPDQCSSHPAFGRHIAEVWDSVLNKFVFEFYLHVPTVFPVIANTADNDRCLYFDRQRMEIKTYDQSPDSLIGTIGETMIFKRRFKIPSGFKPSSSFTHIHQIKAVGGDDYLPFFTLTARKGTTNKLELNYVADSSSNTVKYANIDLSLFENVWVQATQTIKIGINGTYSITIKKVNDGSTLMSYSNNNIKTIRPSNTFIRPKWGMYRSLNSPNDLRDESMRFADFFVDNITPSIAIATASTNICNVNAVTFSALSNNAGISPSYQWKKNGVNIDTGKSIIMPANSIANGNIITCILTVNNPTQSNNTATSNAITMSVTTATTPSIIVSASINNVCAGTTILFTAKPTNGGTSPLFNFKVNGLSVQNSNSNTYNTNALLNGSIVSCQLTANNNCQTASIANSNSINTAIKANTNSINYNSICATDLPFNWNGINCINSGIYTKNLINMVGCDSIATLYLTVLNNSLSNTMLTICSSQLPYRWNGVTFNSASTKTAHLTNSVGCDSAATLYLSINNAIISNATISSCGNYSWNGTTYHTTGIYFKTFIGINGCDSTAILNLTLGNITSSSVSITKCGSYIWNGVNYTTSGTYNKLFTSATGCDSTAILNLTILNNLPTIQGASSVCVGSTIVLTNSIVGGVWSSLAGRATINTSGVVTGQNIGSAAVIKYALNTNGCNLFTTKNITVNALPATPSIGYKAPFSNPQQGAPYQGFCVGKVFGVSGTPSNGVWSAGGCISVTSAGIATINTTGAGSLTYTYTNGNGCVNSRTMTGTGYTCAARGVAAINDTKDQYLKTKDFALFPNPAKSYVSLQVETLIGTGSIVINDLYGKTVKTQPLSMGNNTVDIANLTKGFYLISTITSEGKTTKKLVIGN